MVYGIMLGELKRGSGLILRGNKTQDKGLLHAGTKLRMIYGELKNQGSIC